MIRLPKNYPFVQPEIKFKLGKSLFSILKLEEFQPVQDFFKDYWTANFTIYDIMINSAK